jgi:hypothetical protein
MAARRATPPSGRIQQEMRYTPLNLHTVENSSLESGPLASHVPVYLNLYHNFILIKS